MESTVHLGNCIDVMRTLDADSVDAIVTDPPYHLTNRGGGPRGKGLNTPFSRSEAGASRGGFMGKKWDGGDLAHRPSTWAEALRVAKPGAWLLAFGGTRTYHRLACAIEDAGWELRDGMVRGHDCPWLAGWMFGSGFPKSHNLCRCGTERFDSGLVDQHGWRLCGTCSEPFELGTALKPAWEPIVMARKPLGGTVAVNVNEHGTGALNVEGCRIAVDDESYSRNCSGDRGHGSTRSQAEEGATNIRAGGGVAGAGRWPANLMHDGSDAVVSMFPREAGASAPVQGTEPSSAGKNTYGEFARGGGAFHGDAGSAARFFYCPKASREDRNDGVNDPGPQFRMGSRPCDYEEVNADGKGNHHPTVKPTELMRYLCRLVTPRGGLVLDPFCGSGSTGRGAIAEGYRFIGIELDPEYARIAEARIRVVQPGLELGMTA